MAANAIVWASEHPRRELNVGWGTSQAIIANAFAPGLLDRYLARIGYEEQQSDEPEPSSRPDNLFTPVPGDAGVHGAFGEPAKTASPQLLVNTHRGAIGAVVAVVGAIALARLFARR